MDNFKKKYRNSRAKEAQVEEERAQRGDGDRHVGRVHARRKHQIKNVTEFKACLESVEAMFKLIPSWEQIVEDYKEPGQFCMDFFKVMSTNISLVL